MANGHLLNPYYYLFTMFVPLGVGILVGLLAFDFPTTILWICYYGLVWTWTTLRSIEPECSKCGEELKECYNDEGLLIIFCEHPLRIDTFTISLSGRLVPRQENK